MDWILAITRNRDALKPIIAALCAMARLMLPRRGDVSRANPVAKRGEFPRVVYPATLPRHVIAAILHVLRPAESAVRRLIVILATLTEAARQASALPLIRSFGPPDRGEPLVSPAFGPRKLLGEGETREDLRNDQNASKELNHVEDTSESMRLSPSSRLLRGEGGQRPDEGQRQTPAFLITSGDGSRLFITPAFALFDPLKSFDPDAIWNLDEANESGFRSGDATDPTSGWHILADANEPLPANAILRRLAAIARALDTLPYQARRLLRFNARRDAQLKKTFTKPTRLSPTRPGFPPGWRQRSIHEIDPILKECHLLANDLLCDTG